MAVLEKLRLFNFRNLSPGETALGPSVNIFFGENAQGKTNFLEAVHLVSNLQSFRTRRMGDIVRHGEKTAAVRAIVSGSFGGFELGLDISPEGRKASLDGMNPRSASEYLGVFRTVFFGPQDMEMAAGSHEMRRRYSDRASFSVEPGHLERLKNYARALKQRNEAIRRGIKDLSPWSAQLAELGFGITKGRADALNGIGPVISSIHADISGGREKLELRLKGAEKLLAGGSDGYLEMLSEGESEDRARGFTRKGSHRDRIDFLVDGREASSHASQGQKRTAVLAMKLALLAWTEETAGDRPTFLLDDPGSELDSSRLGYLGEFLRAWPGQTLIASVGPDDVPVKGTEKTLLKVVAGDANRVS